MSDKDLTKKDLQKIIGATPVFGEETLPEVKKDVDEILEELDKELAENKKTIEKNTKEILATISYEEFLKVYRLA